MKGTWALEADGRLQKPDDGFESLTDVDAASLAHHPLSDVAPLSGTIRAAIRSFALLRLPGVPFLLALDKPVDSHFESTNILLEAVLLFKFAQHSQKKFVPRDV